MTLASTERAWTSLLLFFLLLFLAATLLACPEPPMADTSRFPEGVLLQTLNPTTDVAPVGTVIEYQGDLYRSNNATVPNWTRLTSTSTGMRLIAAGVATVTANPTLVAISGATTDAATLALVQVDDSGATLGGVNRAGVFVPGTLSIFFTNAPTNNDGTVSYAVFDD